MKKIIYSFVPWLMLACLACGRQVISLKPGYDYLHKALQSSPYAKVVTWYGYGYIDSFKFYKGRDKIRYPLFLNMLDSALLANGHPAMYNDTVTMVSEIPLGTSHNPPQLESIISISSLPDLVIGYERDNSKVGEFIFMSWKNLERWYSKLYSKILPPKDMYPDNKYPEWTREAASAKAYQYSRTLLSRDFKDIYEAISSADIKGTLSEPYPINIERVIYNCGNVTSDQEIVIDIPYPNYIIFSPSCMKSLTKD